MSNADDSTMAVAQMFAKLTLRTSEARAAMVNVAQSFQEARISMANFVSSVKPMRLNVRDHWNPNKIIGTLPWDGLSDRAQFVWTKQEAGYMRRDILTLNVSKFASSDETELAYDSGMHDIEVLRKLPGFQELV